MTRGRFRVVILVLGSSVSSIARAAEPPRHLERSGASLAYSADPACPDSAVFAALVASRLRRSQLSPAGATVPEYGVTLTRLAEGFSGELRLSDEGHEAESRRVSGDTCEQVAEALAVVTALAMDARADEAKADDARAATPAATPTERALAPSKVERPAPMTVSDREQGHRPSSELPTAWTWAFGVRGYADTPKAPRPLPGADISLELEAPGGRWSFFLAGGFQYGAALTTGSGRARFSWAGGRAGIHYLIAHTHAHFGLASGVVTEVGLVRAEGFVTELKTVRDPWVALGASVRGTYTLGALRFSAEMGPLVPLTFRDRYVFGSTTAPSSVVHDVPAVGGFLALGASLRFE